MGVRIPEMSMKLNHHLFEPGLDSLSSVLVISMINDKL